MLYSFTPSVGAMAGSVYYLPPQSGEIAFPGSFDDDTITSLSMEEGGYDMTGAGSAFLAPAVVPVTYDLIDEWLINNPNRNYGATVSGREAALFDFVQAVIDGGFGVLVNNIAPFVNPRSGITVNSGWARCKVVQTYTPTRFIGGTRSSFAVSHSFLSPRWTLSDGTQVPIY